jgi:hypothetical protein
MGAMGVWGGIAFSHIAAAAAVGVWYVYGDWATNVLEGEETSENAGTDVAEENPDAADD